MDGLIEDSIRIMKRYQVAGGAIPAAPFFRQYQYCWLRDGTFVAAALSASGERDCAREFFRFSAAAIQGYRYKLTGAVQQLEAGRIPGHNDMMHTRFTLNGREGTEPWGNFQLDGYGTWLWGVVREWPDDPPDELITDACGLVVQYLLAAWQLPCFDPWEEYPDQVHTATLAAIAGGLRAIAACSWADAAVRDRAETGAAQVLRRTIGRRSVLGKYVDDRDEPADAAVLWAFVPFEVVPLSAALARSTIDLVQRHLAQDGVKRYREDTYYGGGDWLITTCWLAWCLARTGDRGGARELLSWVERQSVDGVLPEQVRVRLIAPDMYDVWRERWGPIASPLLWSHAMYVLAALDCK